MSVLIIAATVMVAWFATFVPSHPTGWAPWPLTVVIPIFVTGNDVLGFVPVVCVAALLCVPLVLGRVTIPWWTAIPVFVIVLLAWYYFATGMSHGQRYHGNAHVAVSGSIQALITMTLVGLWVVNRRRPKYARVVIWHLLASLWLASHAFPYCPCQTRWRAAPSGTAAS